MKALRDWRNLDGHSFDEELFAPIRPGEENGLEFVPIAGAEGVAALRRPSQPHAVLLVTALELDTLLHLLRCR
ncbi:unnamed protein product [[Actinomadura] parvosata subsp. kistnae]|uniref:Uncharacterized protein n=1 Tax=[Actinomadura] parvosata subsp. kistnae TaxID=1909395 RepID=A0A1U9ZXS5_9ACTN|nr:hypothetical protein [Nonomuraea sp. ATCC 55076]AQZ62752.1 hypothetical protein BKM31_15950 [Nonomuraea sp. ATCC 55076]SPL89465.1 unnamed protein product [Actinomadura parvosata subsp. kistnae]